MDIGKNYTDGMEVVNSYYKRIADYITSQKDGGYLTLEDSQNDTIIFKMGQYKYVLQMTLYHYRSTITFKTYRLARYPDTVVKYIPEMDMNLAGYRGILEFKVAKDFIDPLMSGTEKEKYVRDIGVDYFYFLDQYVKSQGV